MIGKRAGLLMILLAALALVMAAGLPALAAKTALSNDDCAKCHDKQPADIAADGRAHRESIGCRDCHENHRPASKSNIPECSNCHEGTDHFKLPGCLGCHKNPHMPKQISFANNITDPCLTCHKDQIKQLKEFPSKHTQKACSFCHDKHGKKPECTQCHKPHAATMTAKDCNKCHKAHQPKNVTYPATIVNAECGSCHKKPAQLLAATSSRHVKVSCVQCHKDKHKMVPKCAECHQVKHPAGILAKFPNCLTCHNHPHDLNSFTTRAAAPAATPAAPAAPAKQ